VLWCHRRRLDNVDLSRLQCVFGGSGLYFAAHTHCSVGKRNISVDGRFGRRSDEALRFTLAPDQRSAYPIFPQISPVSKTHLNNIYGSAMRFLLSLVFLLSFHHIVLGIRKLKGLGQNATGQSPQESRQKPTSGGVYPLDTLRKPPSPPPSNVDLL